jgi:hypothetical protein
VPAAGWFPDPYAPGALRWWDGANWTEHNAPAGQAPASGVAGADHELDWLLPINRSGAAIAAGYLGLVSFIPNPFTSIPAMVCGVVALSSMKRTGKLGRGRAWFGIIVGGLSFLCFLALMAAANNSSS